MTPSTDVPEWYTEGQVAQSVRQARQSSVSKSSIVWGLEETAFEDIPKGRIKAIVESVPESDSGGEDVSIPLSQDPSVQAAPRENPTRIAAAADMQYLSPREAARLVGLALEQFDGNTVRPDSNKSTECDLYWNRQHNTIGLRLVPVTAKTVGEQHVVALIEGQTTVADMRDPSELAIVTNGTFTEKAKSVATDHGILLFDGGHLEAWLRRAKIPREAVGTVLEEGENHDGPLDGLVELPELPSVLDLDPLEMERAIEEDAIPDGTETTTQTDTTTEELAISDDTAPSTESGIAAGESTNPSGETGILYADPDEDGDYSAFDRYVDDLKHGGSTTEQSDSDGGSATSNDETSVEDDEDSQDVSRKELLFDLIDIKKKGGEPVTLKNVEVYGSYATAHYEAEFGSLTSALDAANIAYDGDSL